MSVSVIIPCFNSEKTIERAIESVLCQEINDLEIILIDDGSTDGTAKKIKKYNKHVKYRYQKNKGVSVARNLGIKLSTRPLIALLDSDDEWLPGKLKYQLGIFDRYRNISLSATGANYVDENGNFVRSFKHDAQGNLLTRLLQTNLVTSCSAVFKRESIQGIQGPFLSGFKYGEDYLLWIQLAVRHEFHISSKIYVNYTVSSKENYLNKYSEEDVRFLFEKIADIIKSDCTHNEIKSLSSTMHFSLASICHINGERSRMFEESLEGIKTYPWSLRNLVKFVFNVFRFFLDFERF